MPRVMPRVARAVAAALALVFLVALAQFVFARPQVETRLPRSANDPVGRHDLADYHYGPTIRVSSVNWASHLHPAYLVDRMRATSGRERWESAPKDPAPWAEVELDRAHDIDEVVIDLTVVIPGLKVECFAGPRSGESLLFTSNTESSRHVKISCPGTDRVRVTFLPGAGNTVSVQELEVWGT